MGITTSPNFGFPILGATSEDYRLADVQSVRTALLFIDEKLAEDNTGPAGPQGPQGSTGPAGPQGQAASFYISATFPGAIGPLFTKSRWSPPRAIVLTNITFNIDTAAASNPIVLDIKKNGVSVFDGSKPSIGVGIFKTSVALSNIAITDDDYITLDIVSGDGADLSVRIDYV